MFKPLCFLPAFLMLLSVIELTAQSKLISISGTYAPIIMTINEDTYRAFGVSGEFEHKFRKHLSFGVELDWQKYTPETVFPRPVQPTTSVLKYTINRYQINLRPIFRYYWKENFQGVNIGVFPVYSRLITTPKKIPFFPGFNDEIIEYPYKSAVGFGITYGYRFKLTPTLRLSVLGNHQLVFSSVFVGQDAHQDHQFGLGLNWAFGS